jgi:hypothetical protein
MWNLLDDSAFRCSKPGTQAVASAGTIMPHKRQSRVGIDFSMSMETLFSNETHPRPRSWRFWLLVASPFLLLGMCTVAVKNALKSVPLAQSEAKTFHDRFEAGRYGEIYAAASPTFQSSIQESQFEHFLEGIHTKMGACKPPTKPASYFANANQSITTIRLKYRIECSTGALDETITFRVEDGLPKLQLYQASSPFLRK